MAKSGIIIFLETASWKLLIVFIMGKNCLHIQSYIMHLSIG